MYRLKIITQSGVHDIEVGTLFGFAGSSESDNRLNCAFGCKYSCQTFDTNFVTMTARNVYRCILFDSDLVNRKRLAECIEGEKMFEQYGKLAE